MCALAMRRWMRHTMRWPWQRSTGIEQRQSRLLALPPEVLVALLHLLPADAQISIALTCRWLRLFVFSCYQYPLLRTLPADRLQVLGGLLLDRWFCEKCQRLHKVDERDTPDRWRSNCPTKRSMYSGCSVAERYGLKFRHIQQAMKYIYLQQPRHIHLKRLLKTYDTRYQCYRDGIECTVSAQPKIMHDRFFVKKTYRLTGRYLLLHPVRVMLLFHICIHSIDKRVDTGRDMCLAVYALFNQMREYPDVPIQQHHSCLECPTDYTLTLKNRRSLTVEVWFDFGRGISSRDEYWMCRARGSLEKGYWRRGPFDYRPGSVREKFETKVRLWQLHVPDFSPNKSNERG